MQFPPYPAQARPRHENGFVFGALVADGADPRIQHADGEQSTRHHDDVQDDHVEPVHGRDLVNDSVADDQAGQQEDQRVEHPLDHTPHMVHGLVAQDDRRSQPGEHDARAAAGQHTADLQHVLGHEEDQVGGGDRDGDLDRRVDLLERPVCRAQPPDDHHTTRQAQEHRAKRSRCEEGGDGRSGVDAAVEGLVEDREQHHGRAIVQQGFPHDENGQLRRGSCRLQQTDRKSVV